MVLLTLIPFISAMPHSPLVLLLTLLVVGFLIATLRDLHPT